MLSALCLRDDSLVGGSQKTEFRYPKRPGVGKLGKPIQVEANVFTISKLPENDLYHYDVSIEPDVPPKLNRYVHFQASRCH